MAAQYSEEGKAMKYPLILLSGTRIFKTNRSGRDIVKYRVGCDIKYL